MLVFLRSSGCYVLQEASAQEMCDPCKALEKKINRKIERKQRGSQTPANDKAPLAACGPEKLRATVNMQAAESARS